jgi:hypothetical protein
MVGAQVIKVYRETGTGYCATGVLRYLKGNYRMTFSPRFIKAVGGTI